MFAAGQDHTFCHEGENNAHWVLDVAFKEDDYRIRLGNEAENVGMSRRLCLNLLRLYPRKNSRRGKRKQAGWRDIRQADILLGESS